MDYADAITLAARRISSFEHRPLKQVLRDLLQPRSDTVRHALSGATTGTVQLRPSHGAVPAQFVGMVVELSGSPNIAGQLEGDVVLQVQADDQLLKVRVTLGPDDYAIAGTAHLSQQFVSVHGQLHRGRRTHVLKNATNFTVLPP